MTLIQGRSSFGAFVRSPFGARGPNGSKFSFISNGVGGCSINGLSSVYASISSFHASYSHDRPYNTHYDSFYPPPDGIIGKGSSTLFVSRYSQGCNVSFSASIWSTISIVVSCTASGWSNTLETWYPALATSLGIVGSSAYGGGVVSMSISNADIRAAAIMAAGEYSFGVTIGNNLEMTNSGIGVLAPGSPTRISKATLSQPTLVFTY